MDLTTTKRSAWCLALTILAWLTHAYDALCTLWFIGHELAHQGEICQDGHRSPMALSPAELVVVLAIVLAPTLPSIYMLTKKTTIGWTIFALVLAAVAWVDTGTVLTIGALSTACWGSL